jgi:energy-coupling factor transport system permease protein
MGNSRWESILTVYHPSNSWLHRLDSRVKLILAALLISFSLIATNFLVLAYLTLIFLLIAVTSKLPVKVIFRSLKPMLWLAVFVLVAQTFFSSHYQQGTAYWRLPINWRGFWLAVLFSGRLTLMLMFASMFSLVTQTKDIVKAIEFLLKPVRLVGLSARDLALAMTLAIRFIPILFQEAETIKQAQRARGVDINSKNLLLRLKNVFPMLIPLVVSVFRRADSLALAMESRGYYPGMTVSRKINLKTTTTDWLLVFMFAILILPIFWLGR